MEYNKAIRRNTDTNRIEILMKEYTENNTKRFENIITTDMCEWRCPEGHIYKSLVGNRLRMGTGCTFCTNREVLKGYNDLSTLYSRLQQSGTLRMGN